MEWRKVIAASILFGTVAALIVWWLANFEQTRVRQELFREIDKYRGAWDAFSRWSTEQSGGGPDVST